MMSVTRTFIMITLMILKLSMVIRMISLMIIMVLIRKIIRVIYMKVCQFQCCPYCDTQLTHQPSKPRPPPSPVKPPCLHRFTTSQDGDTFDHQKCVWEKQTKQG